MAGQGTYMAYQPLKPTELKVGDYFNSFVDDYLKRNDAKQVAEAKRLADQKKGIDDKFNSFKTDPYATISQMSDFALNSFNDTTRFIGEQRLLAERDPANAQLYMRRAENAYNDYRGMATTLSNPEFIKQAKEKQEAIVNGDVFLNSDANERAKLLNGNPPVATRNEDGSVDWWMPKNGEAKENDPLEKYKTSKILGLFTSPDTTNMLTSNKRNGNNGFMDKQVYDIAKTMSDEYKINKDGNRTNAKEWFSTKRGDAWFKGRFGEYNPNLQSDNTNILNQFYKQKSGKEIGSQEDFDSAKKQMIDYVASLVGEKEEIDTRKTAQELANDVERGNALRRSGRSSGGGGNDDDDDGIGLITIGQVQKQATLKGKPYSVIYDNSVGINTKMGQVFGIKVPNKKDQKTGKSSGYHNEYFVAGTDKYGRATISNEPMTQQNMELYLKASNIDPLSFSNLVGKQNPVTRVKGSFRRNHDIGEVKIKNTYKPSTENSSGESEHPELEQ